MQSKDFGKIIRAISYNSNSYIGSKIEKYGIKQGQFEYFLLIYNSPGINQIELAKLKSVGKASVTKALKILQDDGFIERINDDLDKRNTLCYVTKKGELIADELMLIRSEAEKILFDKFTEQDKEIFYKHLCLLHQNSESLLAENKL